MTFFSPRTRLALVAIAAVVAAALMGGTGRSGRSAIGLRPLRLGSADGARRGGLRLAA
jgi:hypothetical protein